MKRKLLFYAVFAAIGFCVVGGAVFGGAFVAAVLPHGGLC